MTLPQLAASLSVWGVLCRFMQTTFNTTVSHRLYFTSFQFMQTTDDTPSTLHSVPFGNLLCTQITFSIHSNNCTDIPSTLYCCFTLYTPLQCTDIVHFMALLHCKCLLHCMDLCALSLPSMFSLCIHHK